MIKIRRQQNQLSTKHIIIIAVLSIIIIAAIILVFVFKGNKGRTADPAQVNQLVLTLKGNSAWEDKRPDIIVDLLTPNEYSRPQTPTEEITGIVIHYTANPGSSAAANRSYFEGLKDGVSEIYASSHLIVGLEGEIIQCIPTSEMSYASNSRNIDTVSIEVCHPDEGGKFTNVTYNSLVEVTGWLCGYLGVSPENVIRHYDVTGKECPLYYVVNEDEWLQFKNDVANWIIDNNQ